MKKYENFDGRMVALSALRLGGPDDGLTQSERDDRAASHYFSFFGAVRRPEKPWPRLARVAKLLADYARPESAQWMPAYPADPLITGIPCGAWVEVGCADGIVAYACVCAPQAILEVRCPAGGWAEYGVVAWPLQFVLPAAVAGSCCNPRYGVDCSEVVGAEHETPLTRH